MSVAITGGPVPTRGPGYHSTETLTAATGTQTICLDVSANILGVGGSYSLEDGTEGQQKAIFVTATGEALLQMTGTATGQIVFSQADDFVKLEFVGSKWRILQNSGAAIAT